MNKPKEVLKDFTKNSSFCAAPWLHYYRSPIGEVAACCISDPLSPQLKLKTFEEIINSEEYKKLRLQMMNGVLPKECHLCEKSNNNIIYKDNVNEFLEGMKPKILENTLDDGTINLDPVFLDFRFLDCNITCNTCNPDYSSSWLKKINKVESSEAYNLKLQENLQDTSFFEDEYSRVINNFQWQRIYFAGGEPLMKKNHLKILEELKEKPFHADLKIFYNTNLSIGKTLLKNWLELLAHFKEVHLNVSIDSFGKFNDLIREGSSFEKICSNLDFIVFHKPSNLNLKIDLTITSLFFYNIFEFSEWILKNKYSLNARAMNEFGYLGAFLRPEVLKISFRKKVFLQWSEWYCTLGLEDQDRLKNLFEVMTMFHAEPEFNEDMKKEVQKHIQETLKYELIDLNHFIKFNMKQDLCVDINGIVNV